MKKVMFVEDSIIINNDTLVLTDLHIGVIEDQGIIINKLIDNINKIFENAKKQNIIINKIIILGDIKHDFGILSKYEEELIIKFIDNILNKVNKDNLIIIKGNHDNILINILKKRKIGLYDYYVDKKIGFCHGSLFYKELDGCETLFLGHLHPSITLSDKYKSEKFKCFLVGTWNKRKIYILPSFNQKSYGYDLTHIKESKKEFLFIKNKELINFNVIIYNNLEEKEYDFGKLKKNI